jgi:hypothetical protein
MPRNGVRSLGIGAIPAFAMRRIDRRGYGLILRSLFDPVASAQPSNLKSSVTAEQSRQRRVNNDPREENVHFFTNKNSDLTPRFGAISCAGVVTQNR